MLVIPKAVWQNTHLLFICFPIRGIFCLYLEPQLGQVIIASVLIFGMLYIVSNFVDVCGAPERISSFAKDWYFLKFSLNCEASFSAVSSYFRVLFHVFFGFNKLEGTPSHSVGIFKPKIGCLK